MSFTLQVGTHPNWVGSHYWSALNRREDISDQEVVALYNENSQGIFYPRMFYVDSPDSIGSIDIELDEDEVGVLPENVHKLDPVPKSHPFRESLKKEIPPDLSHPWNFWTDFWELEKLPEYNYILPRQSVPTEHTNKYWFEQCLSPDAIDEMSVRKLVEETDCGVNDIRLLADPAMSQHAVALNEYLSNAFAKSVTTCLINVACESFSARVEESFPTLVNWAYMIHANIENPCLMVLFAQPQSTPLIEASAMDAVWMDTFESRQCVRNLSPSHLSLATPTLDIGGKSLLSTSSDPLIPKYTNTGYIANLANPLDVSGTIEAGISRFEQKTLQQIHKTVLEFSKRAKAVYQQHSIEEEEFAEIAESLSLLGSEPDV